ncbi:plasmid partitioning protein RepB [Tropicibacter oceani]|uniref:Plasmid partitioning protein RepB n=1 Tax=Tropicibacter oceani TaxID=3058420 RepID=A0ABY8QNC5_9RHOB|nr:plasmid partitioning protein RepB [Tropicibacter oceani]WGW05968.1 plasmid partitioning protein RepB [Tropicibacter oceani]
MGAELMARKIFNQPPVDETKDEAPSPALPKRGLATGSVGGLRDSLREITANSIRDIDPDKIDQDGVRDRLSLDDDELEALAESIRRHGQQVPILVRPSGQPERYRIIYGRRRLAAIRRIGGTVKAIVRTLDDEASLIAQGQENNLRLDPSFIEKALFLREMEAAGYKPQVIQDALGLTRQGLSNHRVVLNKLPDALIRLIGPAHGVGRRQWTELAGHADAVDLVETVRGALPHDADPMPGAMRFQTALNAVKAAAKRALADAQGQSPVHRGGQRPLKTRDGEEIGTVARDSKSLSVRVSLKTHPEFGQWLDENADDVVQELLARWQNETRQDG